MKRHVVGNRDRLTGRHTVRNLLACGAVTLSLVLSACGDSNSTPTNTGNAPETTIDGRGAPDVNGNNRDQPLDTAPVAPAPTNAVP